MNKRKLRRVAIVALVLVLLCNTLGVQASTKKDDPTVIVKDYGSLYTAIAEAKDNDVIGIQGTITIPAIVDLNMSENKAVILRRMEAGAKLVVSGDYGADNKASFRMISFDGNSTEVGGTEPFVEINENAYFSMCDFTECFNQSDNGGAINISSGEVELNSCSFDENSASYGSHIFNSGTHNEDLFRALLEKNTGLLHIIVMDYRIPKYEIEDLLSESYIALIKAVDNFDPTRGVTFTTALKVFVRQHLNRLYNEVTCQKRYNGMDPASYEELVEIHKDDVRGLDCDRFTQIEVDEYLEGLESKDRYMVTLLLMGYSLSDCAKAFNVANSSITWRIKRIRKNYTAYSMAV